MMSVKKPRRDGPVVSQAFLEGLALLPVCPACLPEGPDPLPVEFS